jgi:hypothetical protein
MNNKEMVMFWSDKPDDLIPDTHVAFRGTFDCEKDVVIDIALSGASWFGAWLDGRFLTEGPARFHPNYPEYQVVSVGLSAGSHLLAVQVHHNGINTRLLADMPPFLLVDIRDGTRNIPISLRCLRLPGYSAGIRRYNECLGWIEWGDTSTWPMPDWRGRDCDDTQWSSPVAVYPLPPNHTPWQPVIGAETHYPTSDLLPIDSGSFTNNFGYENDDPPVRFFLRDLAPADVPAQGVWFRYDLGRVRLMHPVVVFDIPADTPVEFAYSESLHNGRVAPWITLSCGKSCSLDHFLAHGGIQELTTLEPRGGRFLEIHIGTTADQIRHLSVSYRERCHFKEPQGSFSCEDSQLNSIWNIGVETLRACAEDTMVDTPVRERGAWIGDSLSVGMEIAAVAYNDLQIFRRMFVLAARCAREDGMVAGLMPGTNEYPLTFAVQWASAAVRYWELTGDITLLQELYSFACRNIDAFIQGCQDDGIPPSLGSWSFVDWGYIANPGSDIALNLHYLSALKAMQRWATIMGDDYNNTRYKTSEKQIREIIERWFDNYRINGKLDVDAIGYHRLVLALHAELLSAAERSDAITAIKSHLLNCFPNNLSAPRLSDPLVQSTQVFTPYFAHFALPVLIEHGEMDFVIEQYRHCWGWAMADNRTTWLEVFDRRWSHSHHWSGCPTWQLSRYLLGLWPRFDIDKNLFVLRITPNSLSSANGRIPIPGTQSYIDVDWKRQNDGSIRYHLSTSQPILLSIGNNINSNNRVWVKYEYVVVI